jgi:outer membrane protein assembly factor BamB
MTLKVFPAVASWTLVLGLTALSCGQDTDSAGAEAAGRSGSADQARGWLSWRGPQQNGTSLETGLPDEIALEGEGWSFELAGRGTPVIADGRVYTLGYEGQRAELQELLVCLDAQTGERIWEHRFTDFLTDSIYSRYSIGSPTIDPQTGNVLCLTTAGLLNCFTADGELLWQHSMMSEYGRLSFPNGRTGAPLVVGDLAIVHIISSSWGPQGPARDRFYAFDKDTGESIWSCTPGGPPKDSSFSFPVVAMQNGKQVLYAGLGGGHLVCVNVLTGDPIWRFQMATGGVNSSALLYKDSVIAIHGKENMDSSTVGRMVAIQQGAEPTPGGAALLLENSDEVWRNDDLVAFTSSPVLVGNRVYQTVHTGDLYCVDADTGETLWHEKLGPDQIHASPAWGDGKLYVPMNDGSFHIIRPTDEGPETLQVVQLEGNCLGAPAIADGRIYVHTTEKLYCFGGGSGEAPPALPVSSDQAAGPAVRLQVVPADILTRQGETVAFRVRSLDANGFIVSEFVEGVAWSDLPSDGVTVNSAGVMSIDADASPAVSVVKAAAMGLNGSARVRIVRDPSYADDFRDATLRPHPREADVRFSPPRPYWIGANLKWEIREFEGSNVLAKTLDNPLFQRAMAFVGHPDMSNYTVQIDIMADADRRRRLMPWGGVMNQRYQIVLKGNYQELEISSNMELLKESVPFEWSPNNWYTLKTRVDLEDDGSGWIRAKVWLRDEAEPNDWTIEVKHAHAHTQGSPGIYSFAPQSRFRVYLDNLSVIAND